MKRTSTISPIQQLAEAIASNEGYSEAMRAVADEITNIGHIANLRGRDKILSSFSSGGVNASAVMTPGMGGDGKGKRRRNRQFAGIISAPPQPTYQEAIDAILSRTPQLARTAAQVRAVMANRGIAFAESASASITARIQELLANAIRTGRGRPETTDLIKDLTGWTKGYAENVYRTNTASAYHEGMIAQTRDDDVADLIAGLMFSAVMDSDTRPNHAAAHNFAAPADSNVWEHLRPPLGFQCRCEVSPLTFPQAKQLGLLNRHGTLDARAIPRGAGPDKGFR